MVKFYASLAHSRHMEMKTNILFEHQISECTTRDKMQLFPAARLGT